MITSETIRNGNLNHLKSDHVLVIVRVRMIVAIILIVMMIILLVTIIIVSG